MIRAYFIHIIFKGDYWTIIYDLEVIAWMFSLDTSATCHFISDMSWKQKTLRHWFKNSSLHMSLQLKNKKKNVQHISFAFEQQQLWISQTYMKNITVFLVFSKSGERSSFTLWIDRTLEGWTNTQRMEGPRKAAIGQRWIAEMTSMQKIAQPPRHHLSG